MAQSLSISSMIWSGSSPVPNAIAVRLTQPISSAFWRTNVRIASPPDWIGSGPATVGDRNEALQN